MCAHVCQCVCLCVCVWCVYAWLGYIHTTAHLWRSENNLECQSSPSMYLKHGLLFCYCFIDQASWPDHFQRFCCLWPSSHHRSTGLTGMHCIYIIFISIPVSDALWGFDLRATHVRSKCFDHWAISQLQMIFISCIEYCAFLMEIPCLGCIPSSIAFLGGFLWHYPIEDNRSESTRRYRCNYN